MLVMVEVVRLVIVNLGERRVAVDFMVELGIMATREVVLRGYPIYLGSKSQRLPYSFWHSVHCSVLGICA